MFEIKHFIIEVDYGYKVIELFKVFFLRDVNLPQQYLSQSDLTKTSC